MHDGFAETLLGEGDGRGSWTVILVTMNDFVEAAKAIEVGLVKSESPRYGSGRGA